LEDNTEIDIKVIGLNERSWIHMGLDTDQSQAVEVSLMNLVVLQTAVQVWWLLS
jgi:hypothetical protein